ncbi:MAG: hypothetical protein HRU28_14685 [Rhizobiales bacterium]|nr:hypothetical protein [Hyphomicrobiales bacterium]
MQFVSSSVKKIHVAFIVSILVFLAITTPALAKSKVKVLVGKDGITEYDIKIRSNYTLIVTGKTSTAKNRSRIRKKTIEVLIDEKVKIIAATNAGIGLVSGEISRRVSGFARSNKMSTAQLAKIFKARGSNISTLKQIFKSSLLWGALVRQKYGSSASVSEKQIDAAASKTHKKQTVYDLQHIILKMPSNASRAKRNKRLADAKIVREKFTKCSRIRTLTSNLGRVEVKSKPNTSLSSLNSGQRNLIRNASIGTVTKARRIKGGVEMFAICKKDKAHSAKARKIAQNKLVQTKFGKLAEDYLKQLRTQSNVQYK